MPTDYEDRDVDPDGIEVNFVQNRMAELAGRDGFNRGKIQLDDVDHMEEAQVDLNISESQPKNFKKAEELNEGGELKLDHFRDVEI